LSVQAAGARKLKGSTIFLAQNSLSYYFPLQLSVLSVSLFASHFLLYSSAPHSSYCIPLHLTVLIVFLCTSQFLLYSSAPHNSYCIPLHLTILIVFLCTSQFLLYSSAPHSSYCIPLHLTVLHLFIFVIVRENVNVELSKFFFLPTDAQVNCFKTILKSTLRVTLKQLSHISV
jgi:hypothetical protein